jgi:predicted glycosyltransferase
MKIWADIANSPQVLFMRPIIAELHKRGHEVITTTRHHSETVSIADRYGLAHTVIGEHGGGTMFGKGKAIALRALNLVRFLRHENVALAVSGSSYSQALAAKWMRIPFVSLNDYEGNPGLHIVCRIAKKILVPDIFNGVNLYRFGATKEKIETYNGLKENLYLGEFTPDPNFLKEAGLPPDRILVTMRPASDVSAYHQYENPLFDEALHYVASHPDTYIVLLPRNESQREKYAAWAYPNLSIPTHVLDGPNLIYHSDVVISAGGTMNREAVVLGSAVYSLFMGLQGSIDQHLIESGKLNWISQSSEIPQIRLCKKLHLNPTYQQRGKELTEEVVDKILDTNTTSI